MITDLRRLVALDRRAVEDSVELVAKVGSGDLGRATPCSAWTLGDLLAHMAAQHRGFAAAATGNGHDLVQWEVSPVGTATEYQRAAEQVLAAFAAVDDPERPFALPEITTDGPVPARLALSMHFVDYVVHAWDVAMSMGVAFEPAQELVEAASPIAMLVPDDESRLQPDRDFGPAVAVAGHASAWHQLLGRLGRSPDWPES